MKLLCIATLLLGFLCAAIPCSAALDIYGGDASHACVGTLPNGSAISTTGYFFLYKDTNLHRWMFCDPLGNRFFMQAIQLMADPGDGWLALVVAKYNPAQWQTREAIRVLALGFNTVGEYAHFGMYPDATCGNASGNATQMPYTYEIYPARGKNGLKDLVANLPPAYTSYRGAPFDDFFDPHFANVWIQIWPENISTNDCAGADTTPWNGGSPGANTSPWLIGVTEDDADFLWGFHHQNFGWSLAISAPYVQFQNSISSGLQVFSDPVNYTRQQFGTWLCGTRYANLAALNAAWGSTYSTCGSSATTSGTETVGTGNGALTSFSYSFAHGPVDPASIGISVGGTLQGGDTPWFNTQNGGSAGTGLVQAASGNINGGTVSYNSGGAACGGQTAPCITVTFSAAPSNGTAITVTYQYGGWPKATAGGTGLLDEDGTSSWYPTEATANAVDPPTTTIPSDLSTFLGLDAKQYFKTTHDWVKARLPNHLLFGPNSLQGGGTTWSSIIANAAPYLDAFMIGAATPEYTQASAGQTATTLAYNQGGIPIFVYQIKQANPDSPDSATSCTGNVECMNRQVDRGVLYFNAVTALWNNYVGADGWKFICGTDYWQFTDNPAEVANFGLVSLKDNLYGYIPGFPNLQEDRAGSITDPYGYTTTAEAATYGNFVNAGVVCGNQIWLGTACNSPAAPAISTGHLP